jgi:hypothetical protein
MYAWGENGGGDQLLPFGVRRASLPEGAGRMAESGAASAPPILRRNSIARTRRAQSRSLRACRGADARSPARAAQPRQDGAAAHVRRCRRPWLRMRRAVPALPRWPFNSTNPSAAAARTAKSSALSRSRRVACAWGDFGCRQRGRARLWPRGDRDPATGS